MGKTKPQSAQQVHVDAHQNAKLTPRGREVLVRWVIDDGLGFRATAREFGVDPKVVRRWVARYQAAGTG